jgi:hypothetical protein
MSFSINSLIPRGVFLLPDDVITLKDSFNTVSKISFSEVFP